MIHEDLQKAHVIPVCGGSEVRALFPVTERLVYLNHAAISPPPITTIRAIEAQLRDVHERGSLNFRSWVETKERTRELLANLLGAKPQQVGFVRNTSDGLSTVANGINWRSGDNIVTFNREFPSNVYPWLRIRDNFGVEVRICEERNGRIDVAELESLIDAIRAWWRLVTCSLVLDSVSTWNVSAVKLDNMTHY